MASDDHSGARPAGPVVLRIKLRYDDVDALVQRFAPNVGKSGLFLPTKSIQPIGTEVKFELRLANDTPVLVGMGKVRHVKPPDPKQPRAAFGMAIELTRVSREGREVIIRMIERRRAMGLPDIAIPVPEDIDAARRSEADSQPRAETSGIVREAMAQFASAPVAEQVLAGTPTPTGPIATVKDPTLTAPIVIAKGTLGEPVATAKGTETDAVPVMRDVPAEPSKPAERPSAPLMTAPRPSRSTAEHKAVVALAPEPTRAKRPRVADLIAKAAELSGPLAAAAELDEQVDVHRALARARALAGGDLDAELAAVRESAAAPLEISIEAASAELARQLGGKPIVKRDRSAGWAPPPAVSVDVPRSESTEFATKTRAETEIAPSAVIADVTDAAVGAIEPAPPAESAEGQGHDSPLLTDEAPISMRAPSSEPIDEDSVLESTPVERVEPDVIEQPALFARAESPVIDSHGIPRLPSNLLESEPIARVEPVEVEPVSEPEPIDRDAHMREGYERDASQPGAELAAVLAGAPADDEEEPMELDASDLELDEDAAAEYAAAPSVDEPPASYAETAQGDDAAAFYAQPDAPALYAQTSSGRDLDVHTEASGEALGVDPASGEEFGVDEEAAREFDRDLRTRVPSGDEELARELGGAANAGYEDAAANAGYDDASGAIDEEAAREFDRDLRTRVPSGDEEALAHVRAPSPMAGMMISDDADVSEFERALDQPPGDELDVPADSTQIGQAPLPPGPAHGYPTTPDALSDSLDQQLADAEAEASSDLALGMQERQFDAYGRPIVYDDNGQPLAGYDANGQPVGYDAEGRPLAALAYDANGNPVTYDENGNPVAYDENGNPIVYDANGNPVVYDANGNPIEFDANGNPISYDEHGNPISYDEHGNPVAYGTYDPNAYAQPSAEEGEEISDFEVLAEADEEAGAAAYPDASFQTPAYEKAEPEEELAPQDRPSFDFANALDLGDEDSSLPQQIHERSHSRMRPKRSSSAGDFDAPSNSYTFAENPPSVSFPAPAPSLDEALGVGFDDMDGDDFDAPHGYAQPRPETPARAPQARSPKQDNRRPISEPQFLRGSGNPDDLEDALAALDVDLDDISLDQKRSRRASAPSQRTPSGPRPLPGLPIHRPSDPAEEPQSTQYTMRRPKSGQDTVLPKKPIQAPGAPKRANTDDGILIDFDDDDE